MNRGRDPVGRLVVALCDLIANVQKGTFGVVINVSYNYPLSGRPRSGPRYTVFWGNTQTSYLEQLGTSFDYVD